MNVRLDPLRWDRHRFRTDTDYSSFWMMMSGGFVSMSRMAGARQPQNKCYSAILCWSTPGGANGEENIELGAKEQILKVAKVADVANYAGSGSIWGVKGLLGRVEAVLSSALYVCAAVGGWECWRARNLHSIFIVSGYF
ncbi:hypothetical protein L484_027669 [Morus notabilis]|uniref:Uncharacterized protein n=1 Tax=Morus notabilis TaxID=981085 RepID=W9S1F1_9ROSA|nr:hypothetical protein L484_027669 [Morus notabilis]